MQINCQHAEDGQRYDIQMTMMMAMVMTMKTKNLIKIHDTSDENDVLPATETGFNAVVVIMIRNQIASTRSSMARIET